MDIRVGDTFTYWEVVGSPTTKRRRRTYVLCQCQCGAEREVEARSLKIGDSTSCGCRKRQVLAALRYKHGLIHTRLHRIWRHIRRRCYTASTSWWYRYGGRGIKMCDEWRDDFSAFYTWAMANGYRDDLTIDRIDNDGNYEPSNCQFLTRAAHARKTFAPYLARRKEASGKRT